MNWLLIGNALSNLFLNFQYKLNNIGATIEGVMLISDFNLMYKWLLLHYFYYKLLNAYIRNKSYFLCTIVIKIYNIMQWISGDNR